MINIIALASALAALTILVVNVACATYTIKINSRIAVFYGLKAVLWYRKHCGTKKTKYRLTAVRF